MKKILVFIYIFSIIFAGIACSEPLGSAKGKVINVLTAKPVEGASVTATTQSDVENEQRYTKVTTKTGKDGSFEIKGLREKSYNIIVYKNNYTLGEEHADIPKKSNVLIKQPIELCPLPTQGPGFYAFTDTYKKITESVPYIVTDISGKQDINIKAKDLVNIAPIKPKYLINYDNTSEVYNYRKMYLLFKNSNPVADNNDELYTLGKYNSQYAETEGSIEISLGSNYNETTTFFGPLRFPKTVFRFKDKSYIERLRVFDISDIPIGYYFIHTNRNSLKNNVPSVILNIK